MDGKIPLTRDFVKKLYQIEKSVKYDDIDFDRAEKYARAKLCEEVGHFKPNFKLIARFLVDLYKSDSFEHKEYRLLKRVDSIVDKLNIFSLCEVLRFKCGFRDIKAGLDRFNKFLKSKKGFDDTKDKTLIEYLFQATLDKKLPITHDFYLKYYQLQKDKRLEEKYDFILLDEAQDTNEVMLDIFLDNDCKKIFVGDTSQKHLWV